MSQPTHISAAVADWRDAVSHAAGCPRCDNTETPRTWHDNGRTWWLSYLCSDCGTAWTHETKES